MAEAAALAELVHARDFHAVALDRRAAAHERALGGGAAHVEGEQVGQVEAAAVVGAHQGAGGGAGFQRTHREAPRRVGRQRAAARGHDVEAAAEALVGKACLQPLEIAVEHRLGEGVDGSRGPALELAHVGKDIGRGGHEELRRRLAQDLGGTHLVRRVGVGMEEADRNRGDIELAEPHARRCRTAPSSSGSSMLPSWRTRSRTSRRSRRGTSGGGYFTRRSNRS